MADIFVSYAKTDRSLASKLVAMLEAEGWSVWWDTSLGAADLYRDEIMKQLVGARAVITIWTENSVRSDWVRAEAGRAKAEGKLIPVKTSDIAYADIPLPFGEMHTDNIASADLIRAAVVAQLAKPAVPVSQFWQITSILRLQVLTWVGIVGSSITLFANLNGVLDLADWARELVYHWHDWNQMIWQWAFRWINIKVPVEWLPTLSFSLFVAMLVIGVNLSRKSTSLSGNVRQMLNERMTVFLVGSLSYVVTYLLLRDMAERSLISGRSFSISIMVCAVWSIAYPVLYLLFVSGERQLVLINSLLFLFMGACLLLAPIIVKFDIVRILTEPSNLTCGSGFSVEVLKTSACELDYIRLWRHVIYREVFAISWTVMFQVCWMAVILFSPLQQLTRRLGFVVLGVLTLVALSEISKLNLHQYLQPPKASENSSPAHNVLSHAA